MTDNEDMLYEIFESMMQTGLVSTSSHWIEIATAQKNTRLTLELACSRPVVYDRLDLKVLFMKALN